jgi:hypothetical protein
MALRGALKARHVAAAATAAAIVAPWAGKKLQTDVGEYLAVSPQQFPAQAGARSQVVSQIPTVRQPRSTAELEYDFIHETEFTNEMQDIAGRTDFRTIIEEGCFCLEGVPDNVLEKLFGGQKVFARKGTVLIEEGAENTAVFLVGNGLLSVKCKGVQITSAGPGQIEGFYAMLKKTLAPATVTVESDTAYVLQLSHEHFLSCVDENPEVLARMQSILRERELQNKVADMLKTKEPKKMMYMKPQEEASVGIVSLRYE